VSVSLYIRTIELDPGLAVLQTVAAFEDAPYLMLLDSAARHRERDARYTFLTADPVDVLEIRAAEYGTSPFQKLREWQRSLSKPEAHELKELPPFFGGIAGLMGYELGRAFEKLPTPAIDDFETPALLAGLYDWAIVWDHINGTVRAYVIDMPASLRKFTVAEREEWLLGRLQSSGGARKPKPELERSQIVPESQFSRLHRIEPSSEIYSDFTRDEYVEAVSRVIEYIRAGDIFQANLSQRLMAPWSGTALQLYSAIRTNNPAPFCGLFQAGQTAIVSASPERFLKVDRNGTVETRPIKGTRRRPRSPIADLYAGTELATSEKDRSENVMIVDLLRNDISRSCRPGSVRVTGLCEIERFETVLHLVSTVVGQLRDECDVWDLMAGCFPGGSITGAPKIRAMQIIAELEPTVRGAYCGSLFALGAGGDFDSSILIRTFTLQNGWVQFPVGGGIVADSDPLEEYRETLHKASGMIRSLRASV
jgi:para-aminobenzoate synthetase component 1